ncbi:MAG: hypothetical protein LIP05_02140 [Tannerellaceae bacterium]|nr:hypothetical protein [Tannerellaceae bacterium]
MKKSIIYLMMFAIAFMACEPIENRESAGGAITVDQLDISATPVVVDGKNSNRIVLENHSPVLSQWDYGNGISTRAYDEVDVVLTGDLTVIFTGLNADGTKITRELPIRVDELSFEVSAEWGYLCGNGEKKWMWDDTAREDGRVFGNGGYRGSTGPDWWGRTKDDIIEEDTYDFGLNAYMLFSLSGAKLTLSSADGSMTEQGTFAFDMTQTRDSYDSPWSIGVLSTSGVTVLNGVSPKDGDAPVYEYDILKLDNEQMVLAHKTQIGEDGEPTSDEEWATEAYFWLFKAAE